MFMVKEELKNAGKLLCVRLRTQSREFVYFCVVMLVLVSARIFFAIFRVINSDAINYHIIADASILLFLGILVGYIFNITTYRSINDKLAVYPQSNTSRLLSMLMFNFVVIFFVTFMVMLDYIILSSALRITSLLIENVFIGYDFNIGFLLTGFLIHFFYGSLIMSIIELIATIVRKWSYFALVGFTLIFSLTLANIQTVTRYISPDILAFITQESSLPIFFLKVIGMLAVVIGLSLVINYKTVYHKIQGNIVNKGVVFICIVLIFFFAIVIPFVTFVTPSTVIVTNEADEVTEFTLSENNSIYTQIILDISHLPRGSDIEIVDVNSNVRRPNDPVDTNLISPYVIVEYRMGIIEEDGVTIHNVLNNIQNDTLIIEYVLPEFEVHEVDVVSFTNLRLNIHLDGNRLYIDYLVNPAQVLIFPVWSQAWQFTRFRDRNIVASPVALSSWRSTGAMVLMRVE